VDQGPEHEPGVGPAAREHDARALRQRLGDREGPEVDVGARDLRAHVGERRAGVHVAQLLARLEQLVQAPEHVVALDHGDAQALDPVLLGQRQEGVLAGVGVHPAGVRHHLDVLLDQVGQDAVDQLDEVRRVARLRVARAQLLHDRHGHLGQVVEREVVERPLAHQAHRPEDRVAPEALSVGDQHRVLPGHGADSLRRGAARAIPRAGSAGILRSATRRRRPPGRESGRDEAEFAAASGAEFASASQSAVVRGRLVDAAARLPKKPVGGDV
jgi:hypothetical protein